MREPDYINPLKSANARAGENPEPEAITCGCCGRFVKIRGQNKYGQSVVDWYCNCRKKVVCFFCCRCAGHCKC